MLNVHELTKKYGETTVFKNVSFSAAPGEIIGLIGENGAGKSTLLNILATIAKPSAGQITLNGETYVNNKQHIRNQIGFVPQEIAIWDEFTVEENMIFFEKLSAKRRSPKQLRKLCLNMKLEQWKVPVRHLSGGMKRKLNLAISLIHNPTVLLLDEPTVGIDLKSRQEIGQYLYKLAKHEQKIIIYTSHDMNEIINLCDRIICLGEDQFYEDILVAEGKRVITF